MLTKIKICGCKRKEDIALVNKFLPDYVGFVFANSKRRVNDELAKELKAMLSNQIQSVGVFVNEPMDHIISLCKQKIIDVIQLHGDEADDYIKILKQEVSQPIIKAIRVVSKEQIKKADALSCDFLLLDTYQKDSYGGSGVSFDWGMIPALMKPYFLAGGININNMEAAAKQCRPYCIDISSGVEVNGLKNEYKISEIMNLLQKE